MKSNTSIFLFSALSLLAATNAMAYQGERLASKAHVTMADATAIALKARPGKITHKELEHEAGGSGLRYTFDIAGSPGKFEVGVDAMDGKILENSVESGR